MRKESRRSATTRWMMSVALGAEAAYADKILGAEPVATSPTAPSALTR